MKLYLINVLLILSSIFLVIPNLSTDLSDYKKDTAILAATSTKIDTIRKRHFRTRIHRTLILEMENHQKWFISNKKYFKYWTDIQNQNNVGKKFTFYSKNNICERHNPVKLEVEDNIIYDSSKDKLFDYIMLIATICVTYFSIKKYRKSQDDNLVLK